MKLFWWQKRFLTKKIVVAALTLALSAGGDRSNKQILQVPHAELVRSVLPRNKSPVKNSCYTKPRSSCNILLQSSKNFLYRQNSSGLPYTVKQSIAYNKLLYRTSTPKTPREAYCHVLEHRVRRQDMGLHLGYLKMK